MGEDDADYENPVRQAANITIAGGGTVETTGVREVQQTSRISESELQKRNLKREMDALEKQLSTMEDPEELDIIYEDITNALEDTNFLLEDLSPEQTTLRKEYEERKRILRAKLARVQNFSAGI